MSMQGKCTTCKVRYTWTADHPYRDLRCPKCGGGLRGTTHLLSWPRKHLGKYPYVGMIRNGRVQVVKVTGYKRPKRKR